MRGSSNDRAARERIELEFDTNFLVEAGAGSGKTHSLARRMAAGIATGALTVEQMAAVTFTRKAASELRARFQEALEERLRLRRAAGSAAKQGATGTGTGDAHPEVQRLDDALRNIERLFAGTIHAFCAHLLRERPVEARVAPGFVELDEVEDARRRRQAWRDYVVGARARGSAAMLELQAAGVRPSDLDTAFAIVCEHEDVGFPPGEAAMPEPERAWRALEAFWAQLAPLVPPSAPEGSRCDVLAVAATFGARLHYARRWRRTPATLAGFLADWARPKRLTMTWWGHGGQGARDLFDAFKTDVAAPFVRAWRQYVYRLALTVLADARQFHADERRRLNVVNYVDLLLVTARLLREDPSVRRALQRKYRRLFIDEFQDTDPVQAEIFLLLASEDDGGAESRTWTERPLRPGALFVVGDPKQSIYRFRRADIDTYNIVRDRIVTCGGEVLRLTANWRSLPGVCQLANAVFASRFPGEPTRESPAYEPLDPQRPEDDAPPGPRLARLELPDEIEKRDLPRYEADCIGRFIRAEVDAGRRQFRSFLVLTRNRPRLHVYAEAFDRYEIPVEVAGAGRFAASEHVGAFADLLSALADPLDGVPLVGVLRGPLFGITDAELFAFREAGGRFELQAPLPGDDAALVDAEAPPTGPRAEAFGAVLPALRRLRSWHRLTRRLPIAPAVERILEESGWLALAGTEPGGARAGDLLQAVDVVRQVLEQGGGLAEAAAALVEDEEVAGDVELLPLEPGRDNVVRLMNLHKAKGLEAAVVFLADPAHAWRFEPDVRIDRDRGRPEGHLKIERKPTGSWSRITVAQPADWERHETVERRYMVAEVDRLLYVAATRARDLLVVGQWMRRDRNGKSLNEAWGAFDDALAGVPALSVPAKASIPARPAQDVSAAAQGEVQAALARRDAALREATWEVASVTGEHDALRTRAARVREVMESAVDHGAALHAASGVEAPRAPLPAGRGSDDRAGEAPLAADTTTDRADAGAAWGSLVHGLLEHAIQHPSAPREDLVRLARWLTVETPDLRPHLTEAVDVVEAVKGAEFWREARAAAEHHAEVPFAVGGGHGVGEGARPLVLRGVIDLVYRAGDGWRVLDYKTDQDGGGDVGLAVRHGAQLEAYRSAWSAVSGSAATEAGVFGVRQMRIEWSGAGTGDGRGR